MVGRRYFCPATGGEGGLGRLRGDLDLLSLGEALVWGRGERIGLAGVEVEEIQVQLELPSRKRCLVVEFQAQQQC